MSKQTKFEQAIQRIWQLGANNYLTNSQKANICILANSCLNENSLECKISSLNSLAEQWLSIANKCRLQVIETLSGEK